MKKTILMGCLAASFMFVGNNVNAQSYADVQKPTVDNDKWSIEVFVGTENNDGINWNAPTLRARYFVSDKFAARLQVGLGDGSGNAMSETNNFYENADGTGAVGVQEIKRSAFNIQLGAEYHFIGTKKLDPYAALGINFGAGSQKETGTEFDGTAYNEFVEYTGEGGYSVFGVQLGLGADFYFVENVYVGLELGLGFGSKKFKDQINEQTVSMGGTSTTTTFVTAGGKESYLGTQAFLRLGWRF